MKMIVFAVALTFGTAAVAQSGYTVTDPSRSSGPPGITQQGTDPEGKPCAPSRYNANTSVYPICTAGNSNPESQEPKRCTKQITDHCIQTYEKGVRRY